MEKQKLTRRQQYTVNMLREAYSDLLLELPADKITIVQICERADINRTTFYRYYTDIEDLRDQAIEELFKQIFDVLNFHSESGLGSAQDKILKALNVTVKNRKLCRHLLCENQTNLAERVLEENLHVFKHTILSTGCSEAEAQLCYSYLCGGLAKLWVNWIESDFAVPKKKVALTIEQIIQSYFTLLENGFILQQP